MEITGAMLIGQAEVQGTATAFRAVNPTTGREIEPAFGGAEAADVEQACALASAAFDGYRETSLEHRAAFLERIADGIAGLGDGLIERVCLETGLPQPRVEGERARTMDQLRLFAAVVRDGAWLDARVDPAQPERKPAPRSDLRLRNLPIGPVAVFGASNFPLAFSVAGGDTVSALAAGCPVVVKAHPAHPGTSELVGRVIQEAVRICGLPDGVFSLLFGVGNWLGGALVADPRIKGAGFTGSRMGGLALVNIAAARPEPIPVYAEMSSINPVILLPHALASRADAIAQGFVASLTMGAGQFCTNPGVLLALDGPDLSRFEEAARLALEVTAVGPMLTPGIFNAFERGTSRLAGRPAMKISARGPAAAAPNRPQAALFAAAADSFLSDEVLTEEVFGASSILIKCRDFDAVRTILEQMEGQLTATLQMDDADMALAQKLLPILERRAGRILVNGWPTGVEVSQAMVHGGPFPATSDGRSTSVGTLAIRRFLRPVCYQDMPDGLLPMVLRDNSPWTNPLRGSHSL